MTHTQFLAHRVLALPRVTARGLLAMLLAADARHRDAHHLKGMSNSHLRDVGLHRDGAGRLSKR